jgi:hypothetical protein
MKRLSLGAERKNAWDFKAGGSSSPTPRSEHSTASSLMRNRKAKQFRGGVMVSFDDTDTEHILLRYVSALLQLSTSLFW